MGNFQNFTDGHAPQFVRDRARMVDISGAGVGGHPKAHVVLRYYEQYSDGTTMDLNHITMDKPILSVFKHAGYVNVSLDFGQREDMDLRMAWNMLTEYSKPINSVSYLPEEIESGYYTVDGLKKMVYFPMFEVVLSPIGKENEYEMRGINPLFFTLSPTNPMAPEPCVLQLTFSEDFFIILDNIEDYDLVMMKEEVQQELAEELEGNIKY